MNPPRTRSPRTIITTDPELDDLNSLIRVLLWSNDLDIAGLVYSSSCWHWAGDPARGIDPHRWPPADGEWHIHTAVRAYREVYPNLVVHDPRYPHPDELAAMIAVGNIAAEGDVAEETPGSELIVRELIEGEGPLFLQAWGGLNTIARALLSVEERHGASPEWPELHASIAGRVVLTSFDLQDATFTDIIRPRWPELELRDVRNSAFGYRAWQVIHGDARQLIEAAWMRRNISEQGPLGREYRVWGDGRRMSEHFDPDDFFDLPERPLTAAELVQRGYNAWMDPKEPGAWISEGDTSNAALLVDNGLRGWVDAGWGGWGGRQVASADDPHYLLSTLAEDTDADGNTPDDWAIMRWFPALQNDFAARLRWSVTPDFAVANHHPTVSVSPGEDLTALPGEVMVLRADVVDPDGDELRVDWWHYAEAGSASSPLTIDSSGERAQISIPADALPGETFHVICEVTDSGTPQLTAYARVVITVTP